MPTAGATVLLTAVALVAFGVSAAIAAPGGPGGGPGGAGDDAVITVVFSGDDMGYTVNSTKGISNIIVQYCDLSIDRHEEEFTGAELKVFSHTEDQVVMGIWVKSGANGIEGNEPPGAGERFDNEGVQCQPATTTNPTPTPTTDAPTPTPTTDSPNPTPTTEIPFFPSNAALVLGAIGALGGVFAVMRRRN